MRLPFLLLFVSAVIAANVVLKEPLALEGPWRETGVTMEKHVPIAVTIQLHRTGQSALEKEVLDRATPSSSRFRQWLSFEDAQKALKADPRGIALVEEWLRASGLSFTSTPLKDQFQLTISIGEAEKLFNTFFHKVENRLTGQTWHRASTLHVPAEVAPHIVAVFGVHGLPLPRKSSTVSVKSPNVIVNVGPKEIAATYQVSGRGRKSKSVRQAVAEFQGEFMDQQDLTTFFKQLVPNAQSGDELVYAYLGNNGTGYGVEALLDIEYIMGLAPGILTEFWAWRNWDFCADLVNWTTLLLNTKDIPLVHSISYGWQGPLSQLGCTDSEIKVIDDNMMTLAGRGTTLIFASGDSGSGYDGSKLWPIWPGSSAWVTAVGSTCFTDNTMKVQMATTQFGSGSGFSTMFDQGPWQKRVVSQYLSTAKGLPPDSLYPKGGRATADVSALGEGYKVYVQGSIMIVGGTSASAPAFAAMISLVNDKLDSEGKKPLGYLNPWIYNNTDMWTDITLGSNKVSRGGTPLKYGFDSQAGWDPATGLGVPIFPKLMEKA